MSTVKSVALQSLTATYTDSEGEEEINDGFDDNSNTPTGSVPKNDQPNQSQDNSPKSASSASISPNQTSSFNNKSNSNNSLSSTSNLGTEKPVKVQRLVSYFDDTFVSDEEGPAAPAPEEEPFQNGKQQSMEIVEQPSPPRPGDLISDGEADAYGVIIPSEPSGQCPVELQDKIKNLYMKMKSGRLDMNKHIQNKKEFRNPSIYEKLIQFCSINELGTYYPPDRFDPFKWSKESYYDELAKTQKTEMEKLEKARKEKSKIEILTGTAKRPASTAPTVEEDAKRRKSKWDQVSTNTATSATAAKPGVVTLPTLTTTTSSSTSTKATIISAFGSLPKKRI